MEYIKFDPLNISEIFVKTADSFFSHPKKMLEGNLELLSAYSQLWNNVIQKTMGNDVQPIYKNEAKDKRFKDECWEKSPVFNFIKQSYLLNSVWIRRMANQVESLSLHDSRKLDFYLRTIIDAMAPTNFLLMNPEVLKETIRTNGNNLIKGARNFFQDLQHLQISTTDSNAFNLGENLAATPGKVVFQNDLMQLLQYSPSTKEVYETPFLIIPAWINKYYILDLQPENSFVKWLVDKGYTVFMISWVNPTIKHKNKSFEDYMSEGSLEAIKQVQKLSNHKELHAVGYCLGGTLLATTLAYLRAQKSICPIIGATFLTTLVDFNEAGDLGIFIDDEQLEWLEERMSEKGYLDGHEMALTFSMIRANDMIWSFYINNYMLGHDPFPFDILYWNADSTRLPAKMHSFYLRNMYQKNGLVKVGSIKLCNVPIDLGKIDIPVYILSTFEDHIAPWTSTYQATQLYKGKTKFVLSGSGHVAGVANHPDKKKYNYWTNANLPKNPQQWLKDAKNTDGSWWLDWEKWAHNLAGKKIPARKVTHGIENAPGSYVKT